MTYNVSKRLSRCLLTYRWGYVGEKLRALFEDEARQRQREHGGTAPGIPKNTLPQMSPSVSEPLPDISKKSDERLGNLQCKTPIDMLLGEMCLKISPKICRYLFSFYSEMKLMLN